ncbi:MAG TPA: orotidine-5'-phosphate decarboxylase [Longimicrobiales bacterium]|nr:orotidine-5'-phosphate decarboxylase [Longimicrobiales bacterium]
MNDLIVALDLPTGEAALDLVDRLGGAAGYYKVGSQLFTREGTALVRELKDREKRVFLDLKFHDIPYTVARAVESAAALGVDMLTIHASGGTGMMEAARDAVGEDGPALVGVTLLTSFSASDVEEVWGKELRSLREEVGRLAGLAADAGLDGVVSSALEVEALKRRHGAEFLVVTPGIRPAGEGAGDQVRTATPAEAVEAGADYLVVGRPIHGAEEPTSVVASILEEMEGAGAGGAE